MSAHTPGPWQRWIGHESIFGDVVENTRGAITGTCVCALPEVDDWEGDGHDVAEWKANMALIAAAPELLAALKRIITEATGHTLASLDQAQAAIAKAEGRSTR